jgi:flagellar hook-length control protein FliK
MSNAVITSTASSVQTVSSNASTNAAGNTSDASSEDKDFASVLDATVTTAELDASAQTPSASRAADDDVESQTAKEESPFDLSALLPIIAAHFAAIGSADPARKASDGAAHADATPQPLTVPLLSASDAAHTIEAEDSSATPVAAATGRTAILADKPSATAESSTAKHGGEAPSAVAQSAAIAADRGAAEITTPIGPVHRAASDASPVLRIETPVAASRWSDELGQKVMWVANRNDGRAELVLTPPHLGRLEVSVAVRHDGETNLMFVSANQQVRDAIEHSLPRLREIFADAGIALGHAGVQSESTPRDGAQFQGRAAHDDATAVGGASPSPTIATSKRQGVGLVDTFA